MTGTSDLEAGLGVVASVFTVFTTIFGFYKGYVKFLSPTSRLGGTEELIAEIEHFITNLDAEERMKIDMYLNAARRGALSTNITRSISSCRNALSTLEEAKERQIELRARALDETWISSLNPLRELFRYIRILSTDLQKLNKDLVITTAEARSYFTRMADSESPLSHNEESRMLLTTLHQTSGSVNIGEQNVELGTPPMVLSLISGAVNTGDHSNELGMPRITLPQTSGAVDIDNQRNQLGTSPVAPARQTPGTADVGEQSIENETSTYESAYGSSIYESALDDI